MNNELSLDDKKREGYSTFVARCERIATQSTLDKKCNSFAIELSFRMARELEDHMIVYLGAFLLISH